MTLGWPPDCWGGQELSVEYSQSSVAALGAKLALLLHFANLVKMETNAWVTASCSDSGDLD